MAVLVIELAAQAYASPRTKNTTAKFTDGAFLIGFLRKLLPDCLEYVSYHNTSLKNRYQVQPIILNQVVAFLVCCSVCLAMQEALGAPDFSKGRYQAARFSRMGETDDRYILPNKTRLFHAQYDILILTAPASCIGRLTRSKICVCKKMTFSFFEIVHQSTVPWHLFDGKMSPLLLLPRNKFDDSDMSTA
ncbi:unnamed protein product [Albugo candida]|uniref:Uncharacterized protein n=1 Tax=Albugo candida TaxID=65357 RepID=A0A024FT34_9STRA|nr:unnamed protein product [Albugo candida]|eukprot:CCI10250.1 unnamed protein product [Albugo candida]